MIRSLLIITPLLIAFFAVSFMHSYIVKIAKLKQIVDNPNARKLQKEPVPILGGVLVFFGIILSTASLDMIGECSSLFVVIAAMMIMLYTGTMDDILDLKPSTRLISQIFTVCLLIFAGDYGLDNLHGLWGVGVLSRNVTVLLTIFACVGIINAMNLIDGVDGLSSGFCIMASSIFGLVFLLSGSSLALSVLAFATVGSLIPFFLHNVFGKRSKMFIGDGGTLVLGVVMSVFVMRTTQSEVIGRLFSARGYSVVAFTLAVLAIPVFDTLRVMSTRMLRGQSPFHPDKTHLHHLFLELGNSHIGTTFLIVGMNALIVLSWGLMGMAGVSAEGQVYGVVALALLFTVGVYGGFRLLQRRSPALFRRITEFNLRVRPRRQGIYLTLQKLIDRV